MYGATVGTLSVYVQPVGGARAMAWTKSGDQGTPWFVDHIDFDGYLNGAPQFYGYLNGAPQFYVTFEGVSGASWTGDISLDDLLFSRCSMCPPNKPINK